MADGLLLSEETYEADHVKHSVGGLGGHIFRRVVHIALAIVPWIYDWHLSLRHIGRCRRAYAGRYRGGREQGRKKE